MGLFDGPEMTEQEKRIHQQRGARSRCSADVLDEVTDGVSVERPTSGIARLEDRIDCLEALVKRIATHLGIEGGNE